VARSGDTNPMNLIIAIAIGILTLLGADSDWNTTTNPDLPSGASMWSQLGPLLVLAVLALVIGLVIMYFRNAAG